ncbi:hypothetical protein JCM11491_005834 [Sporobolomyces phaffii]
MRLIITGANGAAGSEVLRQALLDPRVTTVTTLTRSPLPAYLVPSPAPGSPDKLTQILHADFGSYPQSLLDRLAGTDAVIWALGTSSVGVAEPDYTRVTHEYAVKAAKAFSALKPHSDGDGDGSRSEPFVFAFLSGARTTQTPSKSTTGFFSTPMWARVKGRTEADLAEVPGVRSYAFRPAFIVPVALPPAEYRGGYNTPFFQAVGKVLGSVSASGAVGADVLAKAMIRACVEGGGGGGPRGIPGWDGKGDRGDRGVFENAEILRMGRGLAARD